jgi:hypothetical protein
MPHRNYAVHLYVMRNMYVCKRASNYKEKVVSVLNEHHAMKMYGTVQV